MFNEQSRVALVSFGPLGQGETISYSFFFKTTSAAEVILVAYASQFTPHYRYQNIDLENIPDSYDLPKDLLLLTLKNGIPRLYTSHKRFVFANIEEGALNDGEWNSIAISMPTKSCRMSEIKMYINGAIKPTTVSGNNTQMFFYTTGSMSLGGWGYAHTYHEQLFPDIEPLTGSMDEFNLWGRKLSYLDLKKATKKKFERNINVICDGSHDELGVGKRTPNKCRLKCRNLPKCWGYELVPSEGGYQCYIYHERPQVGNETVTKGQCSPAI